MKKDNFSDYAREEFVSFLANIYEDTFLTEQEHINAVLEFERITEHPAGSDLIYYPETGKEGVENIISEIITWRKMNNKPLFRS